MKKKNIILLIGIIVASIIGTKSFAEPDKPFMTSYTFWSGEVMSNL